MGNKLTMGQRLKEERERLRLSQEAFAAVAGVTRKTLFGYEGDTRPPDGAALAAWAGIGVDVCYVLTGTHTGEGGPRLNPREEALLDNYRHSSEAGKRAVEVVATELAQRKKSANG